MSPKTDHKTEKARLRQQRAALLQAERKWMILMCRVKKRGSLPKFRSAR